MRTTILIGTLVLMAACAEQPTYQTPPPSGSSGNGASYAPSKPDPCNRSDYAYGAAGDADYANCVIQN